MDPPELFIHLGGVLGISLKVLQAQKETEGFPCIQASPTRIADALRAMAAA